jgi:putative ABC transport system ATP-binding protein
VLSGAIGHSWAVTAPAGATVEARDLFKIHKEGQVETVALRGANLTLSAGEQASLVGPSGSGKSTLLTLLAGLSLPSAGEVIVDGQDVGQLSEADRAALRAGTVSMVFQSGNLIPFLNAEENVALVARRASGRKKGKARARELLGELGLSERRRHKPGQLSGGESQRVAVAIALASDPRLLLGDEVTGELDTATASDVMDLLERLSRERGITMLLVTHNTEMAARADRRLVMVDGTVREA